MSLKCLNLDRIRPISGRPQSSALVCGVDNKSSLFYKVPIRSPLIARTAGVWLATPSILALSAEFRRFGRASSTSKGGTRPDIPQMSEICCYGALLFSF
jgi:hypothetical protein